MAYLMAEAPDGINAQAVHRTRSGIGGVELDAEGEEHLGLDGLDVDDVAKSAEHATDALDDYGELSIISLAELPDGMLGVRFDHD
jgi:hypothetical protein